MGKPRPSKSAPPKQSPPPPTKGRRPQRDPRQQQTLIPPNRTLFYGCNGIVAAVQGKRRVRLWASDPSVEVVAFSHDETFAVDLEKSPAKLTLAQKAQVQIDDGAYAPADKGNGSTTIGPRFPAQWQGAYLGAAYISDVYRAELQTQGISLPNPPPGAEGAYPYEYQVAWYWPGVADPRAGRRYFGHHAKVITRTGTIVEVEVQPAGTDDATVPPVRMRLDLASAVDADVAGGGGLTQIDTVDEGALFLGSDPFAAMTALDFPKLPKWVGR